MSEPLAKSTPPKIDSEIMALFNAYRQNIGTTFAPEAAQLTLAHVIKESRKTFVVSENLALPKLDDLWMPDTVDFLQRAFVWFKRHGDEGHADKCSELIDRYFKN